MNPKTRFYSAVSGGTPDRVPTLPKIWLDLASVLKNRSFREVLETPALAMRTVVEAALDIKTDGVRLFHFPKRNLRQASEDLVEIDSNGNPIGKIDLQGGFSTHLNDPAHIDLSDPFTMAFVQFWRPPKPLVNRIGDIQKIAVASKELYEEYFGPTQRPLIEEFDSRIGLIGDCGAATLAYYILLRGMEAALTDLFEQPQMVHAAMEKGVAIAIEKGKFNIDTGLKILRLNDSAANMLVISPAHWREFILPHMKTVCDELHRYSPQVKIYCHICGNTLPILNDISEAGFDCIGPLVLLGGFTCQQARQAVGYKTAFMGGINPLSFANGSPVELKNQARRCIEQAGRKGGFIVGSGCALPRSSQKENLLALHEAAIEYGTYPITL